MTRLRNESQVSDALFRGEVLCFRICLINAFVLANDCECFVAFHDVELSFSCCCTSVTSHLSNSCWDVQQGKMELWQVFHLGSFKTDAKSSMAVLHNRNDIISLFRASNWASESKDSIVSREVTTCAGITAHTVVLAQTRVGFLTGSRKELFYALPQDEQTAQLEETYARPTVTITRARSLCLIMGPLV